ncbi:MAG TPA: hypothetical protein PK954_03130, partial [Anaerolineales bacterium]|nr:hypothetical protein [Anaerolineales bacterium]
MKPRRVALRARVGPAIDLALLGLATGAFWTGYGQATVDLHVAFGWAMTTGVAAHLALHRASVTGLLAGWLRPMTAAQRWRAIFNSGFLATFAGPERPDQRSDLRARGGACSRRDGLDLCRAGGAASHPQRALDRRAGATADRPPRKPGLGARTPGRHRSDIEMTSKKPIGRREFIIGASVLAAGGLAALAVQQPAIAFPTETCGVGGSGRRKILVA